MVSSDSEHHKQGLLEIELNTIWTAQISPKKPKRWTRRFEGNHMICAMQCYQPFWTGYPKPLPKKFTPRAHHLYGTFQKAIPNLHAEVGTGHIAPELHAKALAASSYGIPLEDPRNNHGRLPRLATRRPAIPGIPDLALTSTSDTRPSHS